MTKHSVCKTVAAYPVKSSFVYFHGDGRISMFGNLQSLAAFFRVQHPALETDFICFNNDAPGDIVWHRAGGRIWELERLSKKEMRELARLLVIEPK